MASLPPDTSELVLRLFAAAVIGSGIGIDRNLLLEAPHVGKPSRSRHGKLIRRLELDRIRYYLYYRLERDRIQLLSLWHTSRRPPRL